MGGQISVIKRYNGKIIGTSGWTNSFSNVTKEIEFFTNPDNEKLTKYLKDSHHLFEDKVEMEQYGIFVIDYDTKKIFNLNGYSNYIDILPSEVFLSRDKEKYYKLFDQSLICIKSSSYKGDYGTDNFESSHTYTNISDMKESFKTIEELINWMDGSLFNDRYNKIFKLKNREFFKKKDGTTIHNRLFIDYKKLGWDYIEFDESQKGYIDLYNKLNEYGFNINNDDVKQWDDFVPNDDDDDILFSDMIKIQNREKIIDDLIIDIK